MTDKTAEQLASEQAQAHCAQQGEAFRRAFLESYNKNADIAAAIRAGRKAAYESGPVKK